MVGPVRRLLDRCCSLLGARSRIVTLPEGPEFPAGVRRARRHAPAHLPRPYVAFVMLVALAFGLSFEFPVLLVFLEIVGVLSTERASRSGADTRSWGSRSSRRSSRPVSDPYTMLAMMIPMYLFYEAAIIIGRLMKK